MIPTLKPGTPNVKPVPQTQIRTFGSSEQVPCKVPEFARNVASPTIVISPQYTFSPIDSKQAPVFWAHHSELRCRALVRLLLNTGLRHRSLNHNKSLVLYTPTPPYIFRSSHHQTGSMSFHSSSHATSSDGRVSEFMSLLAPSVEETQSHTHLVSHTLKPSRGPALILGAAKYSSSLQLHLSCFVEHQRSL